MIAKFHDTQDNITEALAEAEKFTLSQKSMPSSFPVFLAVNPYVDTNKSGLTKTEIENLIKITMASSQPLQTQQPQQAISSSSQFRTQPIGTGDKIRDKNIGRFLSWFLGETSNFEPVPKPPLPPKSKKKIDVDSDKNLAGLVKKQLNLHVAKAVKK